MFLSRNSSDTEELYGSRLPPRLFRINGLPLVITKPWLVSLNYPQPGGELYLCLPFDPAEVPRDWPREVTARLVALQGEAKRHAPYGTPHVTSWLQVRKTVWRNTDALTPNR